MFTNVATVVILFISLFIFIYAHYITEHGGMEMGMRIPTPKQSKVNKQSHYVIPIYRSLWSIWHLTIDIHINRITLFFTILLFLVSGIKFYYYEVKFNLSTRRSLIDDKEVPALRWISARDEEARCSKFEICHCLHWILFIFHIRKMKTRSLIFSIEK